MKVERLTQTRRTERRRELREERRIAGVCVGCGAERDDLPNVRCLDCKELKGKARKSRQARGLGHTAASNERRNLQAQANRTSGLCSCGGETKPNFKQCVNCLERKSRENFNSKIECFQAYGGPFCVCCGESQIEFLQLDHIFGRGDQNGSLAFHGPQLYRHLKSTNYPAGFQILCANCNFAKGTNETCPHQTNEFRIKLALVQSP